MNGSASGDVGWNPSKLQGAFGRTLILLHLRDTEHQTGVMLDGPLRCDVHTGYYTAGDQDSGVSDAVQHTSCWIPIHVKLR
jgi:hypothetical protein